MGYTCARPNSGEGGGRRGLDKEGEGAGMWRMKWKGGGNKAGEFAGTGGKRRQIGQGVGGG